MQRTGGSGEGGRQGILDEPFTSLDVHGIRVIEELLEAHTQRGGMLAVTSHHAVNLHRTTVHRINLSA